MLPFTNSMPLDLTVLQLIYQQGGYWAKAPPPIMDEPASPVAGAFRQLKRYQWYQKESWYWCYPFA